MALSDELAWKSAAEIAVMIRRKALSPVEVVDAAIARIEKRNPSLNALVSVGLVSIPGMMTGQIIAGGDPIVAARYQMMIMALWVASATLAPAIFLVQLGRRSVAHHRISGAPFRAGDRKAFRVRLAPVPVPEGPLSFDKRPDAGATTFADDDEP